MKIIVRSLSPSCGGDSIVSDGTSECTVNRINHLFSFKLVSLSNAGHNHLTPLISHVLYYVLLILSLSRGMNVGIIHLALWMLKSVCKLSLTVFLNTKCLP